jgi:hypothetical protein
MPHNTEHSEHVNLYRGGTVVSSLAGAFGHGLRETRLTALLGYLIAMEPTTFAALFGLRGTVLTVHIENCHDEGRSDILVGTTSGRAVIEAKTGSSNPSRQALKYNGKWTVVLTQRLPATTRQSGHAVRFVTWQHVADTLVEMAKSANPRLRFISQDLHTYLEEHNMIRRTESVDIYAREINEKDTLALFMKAQMYCCDYEARSRLPEASYFAPHFGQALAKRLSGVHAGISYVARIEKVAIVCTWHEFIHEIDSTRRKQWRRNHRAEITTIRGWHWSKNHPRSILFLGTPRLVFNPPVQKDNLQSGKGWLSRPSHKYTNICTVA